MIADQHLGALTMSQRPHIKFNRTSTRTMYPLNYIVILSTKSAAIHVIAYFRPTQANPSHSSDFRTAAANIFSLFGNVRIRPEWRPSEPKRAASILPAITLMPLPRATRHLHRKSSVKEPVVSARQARGLSSQGLPRPRTTSLSSLSKVPHEAVYFSIRI
jgi:hypothetical protein